MATRKDWLLCAFGLELLLTCSRAHAEETAPGLSIDPPSWSFDPMSWVAESPSIALPPEWADWAEDDRQEAIMASVTPFGSNDDSTEPFDNTEDW
jgi:hypothetical protein